MLKQMKLWSLLVLVAMFWIARPLAAQSTKPSADESAANAALAERLAQMAQTSLAGKTIVPATLRQSAAMLETAARLNPTEPRFLRLLTEAYLQLGGNEGRDGAASALVRYLALQPGDEAAQIRVVDLRYGAMETADQRKQYVDDLLSRDAIPATVRSHVAVLGAKLSLER